MIHMNRQLFELDSSRLCKLPYSVFCSIISHKSLKVPDENSLYELINDQYCVDSRSSNLLEFVHFEHLSPKSMFSFIELSNTSFQVLTCAIWQTLSYRVSLPVSPIVRNDRIDEIFNSMCCSFVEGSPLNGIISYLTQKCGGHICDRGIGSLNASPAGNPQDWHLRNVASDEPNLWMSYDFKDLRIVPAHYSLCSRRDWNYNHLQCLALKDSQDGKSWIATKTTRH
jgi:hypothetical protein